MSKQSISESKALDNSSQNSFLVETEQNSDISDSVRRDIESKFTISHANENYNFPRQRQPYTRPQIPTTYKNLPRANGRALPQASKLPEQCIKLKVVLSSSPLNRHDQALGTLQGSRSARRLHNLTPKPGARVLSKIRDKLK